MREPPPATPLPLGPRDYERWRVSTVGAIAERLERDLLLATIGDVRGARVLDVGCGDGALAVELARRGAAVVGIDASPMMITVARERARHGEQPVAFAIADARGLPFAAGSFDLVSAVTVLCFVESAGPAFEELARVLRPSGRLVIGELGRWSSWAAARRLRAWLGPSLWRRARFRSARELRAATVAAGLQVEILRGAVYFPRSSWAARLFAPFDGALGRLTTVGAAFLALSAVKPAGPGS